VKDQRGPSLRAIQGYLFYPNGKVIAAALKALSEFFDVDEL